MGLLKTWFSGRKSNSSKRCNRRMTQRARRHLELLERREVLTATLFVDFGEGFFDPDAGGPLGPQLTMTAGELASDISSGGIQGPNLINPGAGVYSSTDLTFKPLSSLITFDYNGDSSVNAQDYTDLKTDVLALIAQAYEPFNVVVSSVANSSIAGIQSQLQANNGLSVGKNDAYVFVTSVSYSGGSLGDVLSLFGVASTVDIVAGHNAREDTVLAFADEILSSFAYTADTALAFTAAHEAGHAFGLEHADNNGTARPHSELMLNSASATTRENPAFFTRAPLYTADGTPSEFNPADQLGNDSDIGYKPDRIYVTGTGDHDDLFISEYDSSWNLVQMTWEDEITSSYRFYSYFIPRSGDHIYVYAGLGNDRITLSGDLGGQITVFGMAGSDTAIITDAGGSFEQSLNNTLTYLNTTLYYSSPFAGESQSAVEAIHIDGSNGNDTLTLRSLLTPTSWSFKSGSGNDTVNLIVSNSASSGYHQTEIPSIYGSEYGRIRQLISIDGSFYDSPGSLSYSRATLGHMNFYGNDGNDYLFMEGLEYSPATMGPTPPTWPPTTMTEYSFFGGAGIDTIEMSMADSAARVEFNQSATQITFSVPWGGGSGAVNYASSGDATEQVFLRGSSYDDYAAISTLDVDTYFAFLGGGGKDELVLTASPTNASVFDVQNGYISMIELRSGSYVNLSGRVYFNQPGHAVEDVVLEGGGGDDYAIFSALFEYSTFHFVGNGGTDRVRSA